MNTLKSLIFLAAILALSTVGCHTLHNAGAPEQSFDLEKDLNELADHYGQASAVSNFYASPSIERRNEVVSARLVTMNLRYIQFVRESTSEKQLLDSAADILVLSLNLAGASVGAASTKTVLAAIAAGVTGSKIAVDKHFYYEKAMPALVATMNANRKQALIPILEGMKRPLANYPFEQALTDLHNYYFAGTFLGALHEIQVAAGVSEQGAEKEIGRIRAKLVTLTDVQVDTKTRLTEANGKLTAGELPKATAVLAALESGKPAPGDITEAKQRLQKVVREARTPQQIEAVAAEFRKQQLIN